MAQIVDTLAFKPVHKAAIHRIFQDPKVQYFQLYNSESTQPFLIFLAAAGFFWRNYWHWSCYWWFGLSDWWYFNG